MTLRLATSAALVLILAITTDIHFGVDLALGTLLYVILAPAQPARILFEMDTTTGKMQAQPNDKTTARYFRERDRH